MTEASRPNAPVLERWSHNTRQMEHCLLCLTAQIEIMEQTLATLLDLFQMGQDQYSILVHRAVDPQ